MQAAIVVPDTPNAYLGSRLEAQIIALEPVLQLVKRHSRPSSQHSAWKDKPNRHEPSSWTHANPCGALKGEAQQSSSALTSREGDIADVKVTLL